MEKVSTIRRQLSVASRFLAALIVSGIVAIVIGMVVVITLFSNTRGNGFAAFEIAFLAGGLFADIVLLFWFLKLRKPTLAVLAGASAPWLMWAALVTWKTCKGAYITLDNWRWILMSGSGDTRLYELMWIIRGWVAIILAGFSAWFATWFIAKRRGCRSPDTQ